MICFVYNRIPLNRHCVHVIFPISFDLRRTSNQFRDYFTGALVANKNNSVWKQSVYFISIRMCFVYFKTGLKIRCTEYRNNFVVALSALFIKMWSDGKCIETNMSAELSFPILTLLCMSDIFFCLKVLLSKS